MLLGPGVSVWKDNMILSFTHKPLCSFWGKVQFLVCKTLQILASSRPAGSSFFLGHHWLNQTVHTILPVLAIVSSQWPLLFETAFCGFLHVTVNAL